MCLKREAIFEHLQSSGGMNVPLEKILSFAATFCNELSPEDMRRLRKIHNRRKAKWQECKRNVLLPV